MKARIGRRMRKPMMEPMTMPASWPGVNLGPEGWEEAAWLVVLERREEVERKAAREVADSGRTGIVGTVTG